MKRKPEYEIIKTRYEVEREKIKEKLDSQCPSCSYTDIWNGGITDGEYDYYTCKKCGTEWKVLREDYKYRRSRMYSELFLNLILVIFITILMMIFLLLN